MTLIYMKPAIEAECGVCGDYVRRGEAWPYSESSGPDSVALMAPEGEACFDLMDGHVTYLRGSCDSVFNLGVNGTRPFIYDGFNDGGAVAAIDFSHDGVAGQPNTSPDMLVNAADYTIAFDGVFLTPGYIAPDGSLAQWNNSLGNITFESFSLSDDGSITSNTLQFFMQSGVLEYTGNIKIYKNNILVSESNHTFKTTSYSTLTQCYSYILQVASGSLFGQVEQDIIFTNDCSA